MVVKAHLGATHFLPFRKRTDTFFSLKNQRHGADGVCNLALCCNFWGIRTASSDGGASANVVARKLHIWE